MSFIIMGGERRYLQSGPLYEASSARGRDRARDRERAWLGPGPGPGLGLGAQVSRLHLTRAWAGWPAGRLAGSSSWLTGSLAGLAGRLAGRATCCAHAVGSVDKSDSDHVVVHLQVSIQRAKRPKLFQNFFKRPNGRFQEFSA